jgi:NAD(P)H-dependent flavin oxidoreductase YrpB (nitropropane dioxygenase family)
MTTKISGTPAAVIKTPQLEIAIENSSWKDVWSAGQSAGMIEEILPVSEIVEKLIRECKDAFNKKSL